MATQTDIPSDLTDGYKFYIFQILDAQLNSIILYALLHGIYTGILAVTLWNIFINKCWPIRRAMVFVIILLHALISTNFAANWSFTHSAFITNEQSFWTIYLMLCGADQAFSWETGIPASISTILADIYMVRETPGDYPCQLIIVSTLDLVLLDDLGATLACCSGSNAFSSFRDRIKNHESILRLRQCTLGHIPYALYNLQPSDNIVMHLAHHLSHRDCGGVLVQSSALYSVSLILDLAFTIRDDSGMYYTDIIASIAKGIASTLLVGRITIGHRARPDDSWQGSVVASASIRSQEQECSRTSSQEDRPTSLVLDGDLEAQRESGVREPSPTFFSEQASAQSQGMMTLPKFDNFPLYHFGDRELYWDPSDEVWAYLPASTNGRVKNARTVAWSEIENFSLNDSIALIQKEEKIVWDMAESMAAPTRKGVAVVRQRRPYTPVVFSMINSAIMSQNSRVNGYFALAFSVFHFACQSHVDVKRISCRLGMISHDKTARNALNSMTEQGQAALQASVASYTAKREAGYCCVLDNIQEYCLAREAGIGYQSVLKVGTAATAVRLEDCAPSAFNLQDHLSCVIKKECAELTTATILSDIDWPHLRRVLALHWVRILAELIPELRSASS
ncbi:uncharacterized protein ARMOST_22062 [Armillaria ostoyae]|uniref:Uncharacterized protein n=1 Tax=Armillaria ostoyae TaxID=47428 RepID=A0A284SBU4_ARMOS|nr:uncharacterized protein ARMOST_22062 [Armillaria ostoyae]